jgi:hypothetical protein
MGHVVYQTLKKREIITFGSLAVWRIQPVVKTPNSEAGFAAVAEVQVPDGAQPPVDMTSSICVK